MRKTHIRKGQRDIFRSNAHCFRRFRSESRFGGTQFGFFFIDCKNRRAENTRLAIKIGFRLQCRRQGNILGRRRNWRRIGNAECDNRARHDRRKIRKHLRNSQSSFVFRNFCYGGGNQTCEQESHYKQTIDIQCTDNNARRVRNKRVHSFRKRIRNRFFRRRRSHFISFDKRKAHIRKR